jgi:hypothetical protein
MYLALDSVCKSLFDIRSVFDSGQSTDKVDVTEISTVSFTNSFLQFYGRYNDLVCQCNLSLGQMLSDVFHTNREAVLDTLILPLVSTFYLN